MPNEELFFQTRELSANPAAGIGHIKMTAAIWKVLFSPTPLIISCIQRGGEGG